LRLDVPTSEFISPSFKEGGYCREYGRATVCPLESFPPAVLAETPDASTALAIQEGQRIEPLLAFEAVELCYGLFFWPVFPQP